VLPLALGAGLVVAGRRVRATVRGVARRPVAVLAAYRTLRLAQACALAGAVSAGGYLAYVVVAWPDIDAASVRADAITAAVMTVSGVLLALAGLWVQGMCRIDPPPNAVDDEFSSGQHPDDH
ncbi:MAG: DUF3180 domain-containing protein, partial [Micrococcales bacterium]|nr:DUF3180 domain-containing protein [Micrococcales bacterium]